VPQRRCERYEKGEEILGGGGSTIFVVTRRATVSVSRAARHSVTRYALSNSETNEWYLILAREGVTDICHYFCLIRLLPFGFLP
jgi:hypothetical protein